MKVFPCINRIRPFTDFSHPNFYWLGTALIVLIRVVSPMILGGLG